ncbi:MAG TPA: hypothetical protein VGK59_23845 [Ohtaekwangia sp.]
MDLKTFAFKVSEMRKAQQDYFEKIAKAKKTRLPADFAISTNALKRSKEIEKEVDAMVTTILGSNP